MSAQLRARYRLLILSILVVVLSAATYGFAAANTVESSQAGEGSGTISGYSVQNISYILDSSDPSTFDTVTFDLYLDDGSTNAPDTTTVQVGFSTSGGSPSTWYSCSVNGSLPDWSCSISGESVLNAEEFHVVATD